MAGAIKVLKHFESPREPGEHHRLVCLNGKNKGVAYFFRGNRVVMGRGEQADIKVHDIKSSREHAEITKVGKEYIITDLGSQNGVVVNDLKIKQHALNPEDKIIIGQTVYQFGAVEVKGALEKRDEEVEEFKDESFEDERPKSKLTLILGVVAVLGVVLIMSGGENKDAGEGRKSSSYKVNEVSDPFVASLRDKRSESKKNKEKLNIYFKKGLREFREGNFFRAIAEFEHALAWSPNDPLAQFYLRKTKEALDESIEEMFIKAKRDEESLKYQKASVSYCGILRLLYRYPEDERFKNAKESVGRLEEKLGLEEGEIACAEEITR